MQNGRFPCKIALRLKKVCYNVSLCENQWRREGWRMGASAPGGTVLGWHLEGQNLKFGHFWRIGFCIAGRIQRVR